MRCILWYTSSLSIALSQIQEFYHFKYNVSALQTSQQISVSLWGSLNEIYIRLKANAQNTRMEFNKILANIKDLIVWLLM